MINKLVKYGKILIALSLIASITLPSYATVGAADGSAFVTKAEFDAALSDFNARLTTFEAGINSKIDSQVSSYLDRNGIWNGKDQSILNAGFYFQNDGGVTGLIASSTTIQGALQNSDKSETLAASFYKKGLFKANKSGLAMVVVTRTGNIVSSSYTDETTNWKKNPSTSVKIAECFNAMADGAGWGWGGGGLNLNFDHGSDHVANVFFGPVLSKQIASDGQYLWCTSWSGQPCTNVCQFFVQKDENYTMEMRLDTKRWNSYSVLGKYGNTSGNYQVKVTECKVY